MPVVDLAFAIRGQRIPHDHGYAVYGALCHALPGFHKCGWLGVHPISGHPDGGGFLELHKRTSLILRLPTERIADALPLAGRTLSISGESIEVGLPMVRPLVPAPTLDSRLVVIKLTNVPRKESAGKSGETSLDVVGTAARFQAELSRQLATVGVRGEVAICGRGRMTVGGRQVVGYSVRVSGLDADASLRLQEHGLGGKRAMGCGIFRKTRGPQAG